MIRSALFVFSILMFSTVSAAEIYSWRDANGYIQYSDRFPTHIDPSKVEIHRSDLLSTPISAETSTTEPKTAAELDLEYRQRRAAQEEAEAAERAEQENARLRSEACEQAKNTLHTLESGRRLAVMNEKGEPDIMDEAMRTAEIDRTKKIIEVNCD